MFPKKDEQEDGNFLGGFINAVCLSMVVWVIILAIIAWVKGETG